MGDGRWLLHLPKVPRGLVTEDWLSIPFLKQPIEDFRGFAQLGALGRRQAIEPEGEFGHPHGAGFLEQADPPGGCPNAPAAGILAIGRDLDQAAGHQAGHDAAHGRGLDLLGAGQLPQGFRALEDQHGKGGQPRRAFAGGQILAPQAAQKVDGGGVQAVGQRPRFGLRPGEVFRRAPALDPRGRRG
jgi:hypothetical protein